MNGILLLKIADQDVDKNKYLISLNVISIKQTKIFCKSVLKSSFLDKEIPIKCSQIY